MRASVKTLLTSHPPGVRPCWLSLSDFFQIPQFLFVSPAAASGSLPTSFVLPWSTEAIIGIQLRPYHGPSLTMGPWRQGQARTQHYWPLGLGTFHCPHGLEGKSLDVLGRYSPPRGLGQTLPASALQGPKYGLYCWIFANKLLLEK